mgnify:CR=1 FL=1
MENKEWFEKLIFANIDTIEVTGCSFNEIDYPYFKKIKDCCPYAKWILNWHNDEDFKNREKYINKLNLYNLMEDK